MNVLSLEVAETGLAVNAWVSGALARAPAESVPESAASRLSRKLPVHCAATRARISSRSRRRASHRFR